MKHLTPPSQLVLRQQQRFSGQRLLLVNAPDAEVAQQLPVAAVWHLHAGYHKQWEQQTPELMHHFGANTPQLGATDTPTAACVWIPKEKALTLYLLEALCSILPENAPIWLVGENRGGIKSIHKQFPESLGGVQKVAVGNHSLLLSTVVTSTRADFNVADYFKFGELAQPGQSTALKLASLPGVFAFPGIDKGSEMLLQHLPPWQSGRVLDFACGHGVLGAWLQRQAPSLEVSYLDVSAMALTAAAETLKCNQLTGTLIAAAELSPTLPSYQYIVSHPPFHTGVATDYKIGQQFLSAARQHLEPQGELWLVANRFLPWPEIIEQSFGHCDTVAVDNKFAVYRAVNQLTKKKQRR